MEIQVQQVPVKGRTEQLSKQIGQVGQTQWDLAGHCYQFLKPRYVGPPWSNQDHSATSPPLCTRWRQVGRHMGPDPPRKD